MTTKKRTLRVDDSKWERFAALCNRLGVSMTARIIEHIDRDLDNETPHEGSKGA